MLRLFVITLFSIIVFIGLSSAVIDAIYGGGEEFPDRLDTKAIVGSDSLELVADLPYPPGNIAVSEKGRMFFTFHPEGNPEFNVAELVFGEIQQLQFKSDHPVELESVLSLRVDKQNRLWLLDYAIHGSGTPKILAISLDTMEMVHYHEFDNDIAPLGSHLNDFQVDASGQYIFIADASIFGLDPAVIVYDTHTKVARRVIEDHESVVADDYIPVIEGQKMLMFGVFAIRPGVDSIALSRDQKWLYFSPVTDEFMHRAPVEALINPNLPREELLSKVERFAPKTMSDGITTDNAGNIYISDIEHSAIVVMNKDGKMTTLLRDPALRWPDGFSFGPEGNLFVTASALQHVMLKPASYIQEKGPYQIFKIKTHVDAAAGH
jgi:sugar lactone lactonase YvrE